LEKKLEKIKIKFKIGSLGDDDEEDDDDVSGTDEDDDNDDGRREKARESGDDGEKAVLQLQIQRLTDALMKLKDLSVMEKKESEKKIRQLERENDNIPVLEEKIVKLKDDVKKANEKIEQLKEQLDIALEAEDMVEELSDKKLELEEVTHRLFLSFFLIALKLAMVCIVCQRSLDLL
jgi:predicted  nucleic acid-binding Zn-ribbon protein